MNRDAAKVDLHRSIFGRYMPAKALVLMLCVAGCGGSSSNSKPVTAKPAPQNYFSPIVAGTILNGSSTLVPQIYTIDDSALDFFQSTYRLDLPQQGPQVLNAGFLSIAQRGLRQLSITASYQAVTGSTNGYEPLPSPTPANPETGSFALELSGQTGGLVELVGQPAEPLVAAAACPSSGTTQTYLFITIPNALVTTAQSAAGQIGFDPANDTAYGTVDISASGSAVNLSKLQQFTLPSNGGTGASAQPVSSSLLTGTCGPTVFGNITNFPGQALVATGGQTITAQAKVGIGPSGMLVEDNANGAVNILGAGTGAVGLSAPQSAVNTSQAVGAQYMGFIYGAGTVSSAANTGWTSHLASFANATPGCASLALSTGTQPGIGTLIYGGDFTGEDPSSSSNGFGNCDFAIDLGTQDVSTNGLYPMATVWIGADYAGNTTGGTDSFPAVAVAGQLDGKFALFVIGVDSTQPWAIYLLQSN